MRVRDFEIHMELPGPGEVSEKKGGAMHKDKRYKEKEEELDELESAAFRMRLKRETFATSPPSNERCFNRILTFYDYDLPLLALATKFGANSLYEAACRCV